MSAGEYLPLPASGAKAGHLFAFARRAGLECAVVAVPRLVARLAADTASQLPLSEAVWQDTRLVLSELDLGLRWRNIFTGEVLVPTERAGQLSLSAAEVFGHFPVALLLGTRGL
jgi:(1->4)-alpha-D-glucan 1-alpha-D-glucosylmutase